MGADDALRIARYQDAERDGSDEVADLHRRAQEHDRRGGGEGTRLAPARPGR